MTFYQLVSSTLNGIYEDIDMSFFVSKENISRRLRARIQNLNTEFADTVRDRGAKRRIVTDSEGDEQSGSESDESEEGQMLVTEKEMKSWIRQVSSRRKVIKCSADILRYTNTVAARNFQEHTTTFFSPSSIMSNLHGE